MQIIKNTGSLIVVLTIAALALSIVAYAPKSSANDWWSQVEQCVAEKADAKRNSDDSWLDAWMFTEWENECANAIPDPDEVALEDIELEIRVSSRPSRASDVARTEMTIISLSDRVIIEGLKVNRGNCSYSHHPTIARDNHPKSLGYGQGDTVYMYCAADRIREVTVYTSAGEITYSFR